MAGLFDLNDVRIRCGRVLDSHVQYLRGEYKKYAREKTNENIKKDRDVKLRKRMASHKNTVSILPSR